jgi:septum site-determining protein MinD
MSQAWMMVSGKGGAGVSVITAALGIAISRRQYRCAAMDADMGLRNLDLLLGLENKVVFDLLDVARRECKLKHALIPDANHPPLSLLAASQMGSPADLNADHVEYIVHKLKKRFEYVLLDAPTGLGHAFSPWARAADGAILIVTADDVAIRDAERIVSLLQAQDGPRPLLIVNRVYPEMIRRGEMYDPHNVAALLDIPLLGYIPNDALVLRTLNRYESFMDHDCPASRAMERISRRFLGEPVDMPDPEKNPPRRYAKRRQQ